MSVIVSAQQSQNDLRRELGEFRDRYPKLGDDELFILWFLRAFVTDDEHSATAALCGGPNDKCVDAVYIDSSVRVVFIVQGKYRKEFGAKTEKRSDVTGFAQLAVSVCGHDDAFATLVSKAAPAVAEKLADARNRILRQGYTLQVFYVTTGKCSSALQEEASRIVRSSDAPSSLQFFDWKGILLLLADYLDGVAPPVPTLDLEIESGNGVRTGGVFNRYDEHTDIESWVFSMTATGVAGLFDRAGPRLFARNVRGFLGDTEINRGMEVTLAEEPEYFWYYNNGITIICDEATKESSRGQDILQVTNPQIINGQQTTRTLAQSAQKRSKSSVLVRVIRVPRGGKDGSNKFETLVSQIVSATNWQNAIRPSDLMSNDRRQIQIERQFRKLNYLYLRKRMTKEEAKCRAGVRHLQIVKKDELAQAVAGCDLDPAIVRQGKERLFEERYNVIFPNGDHNYYLSRYWLMRQVSYSARGYPERGYAKWVVLNFVWSSLKPVCNGRVRAEAFRHACEQNNLDILDPLYQAINSVFVSVLRFYRKERGAGRKAIDVSRFFQRRNLHKEFEQFWKAPNNRSRSSFEKSWARFHKAIEQELAS